MSVFDDPEITGLPQELHGLARRLENGEHAPFYKIADVLRRSQTAITTLLGEPREVHVGHVVFTGMEVTNAAIHTLHEQAHGEVPFRTCQQEPCRDLALDITGPAPLSLPLGPSS